MSTLRAPAQHGQATGSPQATLTSTGAAGVQQQQINSLPVAPAYFDSNGQPTAVTKVSTVGSASATGSVGARTTTETGDDPTEVDDDMSMDTNYRTLDMDSTAGAVDPMDEDMTNRSVGGYDDRLSDDGTASLVGFGEGANSTVSGPIYHRRPLPGGAAGSWNLERSSSGLSEAAVLRSQQLREYIDTSASSVAQAERRDARMTDGVAVDGGGHVGTADDEAFVDTTTTGPVPVIPRQSSVGSTSRDAAERILRERLDGGEGPPGRTSPALGSQGERLGRFYFEERK